MDYRDGSESWERSIMTELLSRLREEFRVRTDVAGTLVSGISMGGMGSLRLAFKYPDRFGAVAALEPAIEPVFAYDEIEPMDRTNRAEEVYGEIFGDPVDRDYWQANHPPYIARESVQTLIDSGLQIYIEVGDEDRFNLFRGGEVLHRLLFDAGVKHEYRLVRGADHVGASIPPRLSDALGFIGRVLRGGF
jgi:S-formylglutathione hydrolase